MDLMKLEALLAIAEYGSFSSAAKVVYRTQSAVSQQIKELEDELNLRLVDRSQRPVSLTSDGAELVAVARRIKTIWDNFKITKKPPNFTGKLVLGYVRSALTSNLSQALSSLRSNYPLLIIKLINTGGVSKHIAQDIADKKIDAGFGVGPLKLPKGVLWWPYAREHFYVIAPKDNLSMSDDELLEQGPYLRHRPTLLAETMIDREIKRRGIKVDVIMELDSYGSILLMVRHRIGVGIVPESYLSLEEKVKFNIIPFGSPPLAREVGIMVRSDNPKKHLVGLFCKAIKKFSEKQLVEKIGITS